MLAPQRILFLKVRVVRDYGVMMMIRYDGEGWCAAM
jgi:hypothetical protein